MDARITIRSTFLGRRTDPPSPLAGTDARPWEHFAWDVTLGYKGREIVTPWKAGLAHVHKGTEKPERPLAADVLSSLCMDALGYDNARDFEEWASEYGYSADSRTAERIYREVAEHAKALRHFLGSDYDAVIGMDEDGIRAWVEGA